MCQIKKTPSFYSFKEEKNLTDTVTQLDFINLSFLSLTPESPLTTSKGQIYVFES